MQNNAGLSKSIDWGIFEKKKIKEININSFIDRTKREDYLAIGATTYSMILQIRTGV